MEMANVIRVYRVEKDYLECIDGNRCVKIILNGEMSTEKKEAYSHLAEGSWMHVQRDFMGNIVAAAPFPRDPDYIRFREESPKKDPQPEVGDDFWDIS